MCCGSEPRSCPTLLIAPGSDGPDQWLAWRTLMCFDEGIARGATVAQRQPSCVVLAPSFLAESVQKGKSMLAGKVGVQLFSPLLRIRDNGLLADGMATAPFDGEGIPRQKVLLVDRGTPRRVARPRSPVSRTSATRRWS